MRHSRLPAGILTRTLRGVTALPSPPQVLHQKRELTPFPPHAGQVPKLFVRPVFCISMSGRSYQDCPGEVLSWECNSLGSDEAGHLAAMEAQEKV